MGTLGKSRTAILLALLAIVPAAVAAQAPTAGRPACDSACSAHAGMGMKMGSMDMGMDMTMMAAAEDRLDSLVARMHSASGGAKVGAMERVIDELLAQRKTMHEHMMHMMHMMHGSEAMPGSEHKESGEHSEHH